MARLQYNPNTIIPQEIEGLIKYLQEELDKVSYTFANLDVTEGSDTGDGGEGTPATRHEELTGRSDFDQHPQSAITNLVADQQLQDALIDRNTKVFFGETEPSGDEVSDGDIWFVSGYD